MSLTRREFLHALGITAALPLLEPLERFVLHEGGENSPVLLGRILNNLYSVPDSSLSLPIHSIHPILEVGDLWYRLPAGVINKARVQPILASDYRPVTSMSVDEGLRIGEWAQVAGAVAWTTDEPTLSGHRPVDMGHGAAGLIVDVLPPAQPGDAAWIRLDRRADLPPLWSQAHWWRPMALPTISTDHRRHAVLDPDTLTLTAYQGDRAAFSAAYAIGNPTAKRGVTYHVSEHIPATGSLPYRLNLSAENASSIGGLYVHNHFGDPKRRFVPIPVQLPVYAARALYEFLPDGAEIRVM